ncbi:unnamed protein product, partial [Rodentolepis nana]|uniref:Mediator of RNA polymerase II transcription subunit 25 n=1 Tax=Rodentolepis nana TaxID=102285 RepID=A0A0R3TZ84_RODNA
ERFHRQLKSAIVATSAGVNWAERLPIILLSIRSTVKEDLGCCPAELVFGTALRLPGEMILDSQKHPPVDPFSYFDRLKDHFRAVRPTPTRLNTMPVYIHNDLSKIRSLPSGPTTPTAEGPISPSPPPPLQSLPEDTSDSVVPLPSLFNLNLITFVSSEKLPSLPSWPTMYIQFLQTL